MEENLILLKEWPRRDDEMRRSYCEYCRYCKVIQHYNFHGPHSYEYRCYAKQMEPVENISECPKKHSLIKKFMDFHVCNKK